MLAVFRGKIKTGRRTEAIGFSSRWRILGLEKFDLSVVCARARLRPARSPRFPRDLHHLFRGIVVGSGSYNAQWFERILRRYQHELCIGYAAEILAAKVQRPTRILIDKLLGRFSAIAAAVLCTVVGVGLLVAGHCHRDKKGTLPRQGVMGAIGIFTLVGGYRNEESILYFFGHRS